MKTGTQRVEVGRVRAKVTKPGAALTELAVFLVRYRTAARRIIAEHVSDRSGKCRVCRRADLGVAQPWPCTLVRGAQAGVTMAALDDGLNAGLAAQLAGQSVPGQDDQRGLLT